MAKLTDEQNTAFTTIYKATRAANQQNRDFFGEWGTAKQLRGFIWDHKEAYALAPDVLESIARVVEFEQGIKFDEGDVLPPLR